ncbi:PepSY-associated TM helix domain-containing protein [Catalinimonas niigatensis]|uniref:PepSY-associated TM helix domain-containing protein n=1 Tax=Catalinimonas niigatensis TaxID=1397264 RepID=UPI0026666061|nr:PepSY-associated TM helix domain-containing protein [Catalinimonas niigatensis]WPP53526.1 PepSY-associated TM helix domain-containing protein [Catalinimonas niigatensis]
MMAKARERKFSWRKLFNDIHLWMGIGSGLILFLVCLSGTVYTFREEIEQLIEPEKYSIEIAENAEPMAAEAIIGQLQQKPGGIISSITIPYADDQPYKVSIRQSEEERRGTTYFVNPYNAQVLGTSDSPASGFFMFMFRMHRWLLLDSEIGRPIVGAATIIFVFLILSGLVLWFPKKLKNIKQGFKIKTSANWKRINHDLHNTLGFYSAILLLIMALTGLCWSFEWYREGLGNVLGAQVFGGRGSSGETLTSSLPAENASPLSVAELIHFSDEVLTYEGDYQISLPADAAGTVSISKNKIGFFAPSASDKLQLDQYSGEVLASEIFAEKPFNERIAASIKPLHMGYVYGTFSKILYFIACLIATSLPVTGTIIWINKLKKKAKKKERQKAVTT